MIGVTLTALNVLEQQTLCRYVIVAVQLEDINVIVGVGGIEIIKCPKADGIETGTEQHDIATSSTSTSLPPFHRCLFMSHIVVICFVGLRRRPCRPPLNNERLHGIKYSQRSKCVSGVDEW